MDTITLNRNDGSILTLRAVHDVEQGQVYILAEREKYNSLHALLAAFPEISDDQHREAYCEICMQLHGGKRYQRIENPEAFRTAYQASLEHDDTLPAATDFGPFDVREIGAPQVRDETLVFYVKDIRYGVPYRVQAPWPAREGMPVRFQLLPLFE